MKNDRAIKEAVSAIERRCRQYISIVTETNECAYSDRVLEAIIDEAERLKTLHESRFRDAE